MATGTGAIATGHGHSSLTGEANEDDSVGSVSAAHKHHLQVTMCKNIVKSQRDTTLSEIRSVETLTFLRRCYVPWFEEGIISSL